MLREVAEYPNSFGLLSPGAERIETDRYTLCLGVGSTWNTVQRQRFPLDELDQVLEEVRAHLRERGRTRTQWEVGSSAPPGLVEALHERGLTRDGDGYAVGLVLTREPPPVPEGLTARRIQTYEEYAAANAVQWEAFESSSEEIAESKQLLEQLYAETVNVMHGVWLDGTLVCAGTVGLSEYGLLLYGGATLRSARGRGAYRALIRARWDEAVTLGTPALITQGGSMSRPILERLGFERLGEVHMLLDVFD
jgi:hypothetical protein